jgi:DNA-binding response OmpR family regulator
VAGAHILVVDDERDLTELVAINLQLAGYRTTIAHDGVDAIEAIAEERPDLVVLDVMMPRLDGWGVLAALQKDPETRDLPVVMLTALANERDLVRGHLSGAVSYVTKPFDLPRLVETLEQALQPLTEDQRRQRSEQLRGFLTRLAELETGRAGGGAVRFAKLETRPRRPGTSDSDAEKIASLSPRQHQIAALFGAGMQAREIAVRLGTSRSNVYAARKRIARHLGVPAPEVPEEARRLGLEDAEATDH